MLNCVRAASGVEPTLGVRADRDKIYLGERFILYVEVRGASDLPSPPDLSGMPDAVTQLLGSQNTSRDNVRFVNGRVTRESFRGRTFLFAVQPRAAGAFRAAPVMIEWDGKRLVADDAPVVEVVGVARQSDVIVTVAASSESTLVDEPFTIDLSVAVAALPAPHADVEPIHARRPPHLQAAFLELERRSGLDEPDLSALLNSLFARNNREPAFTINNYQSRGGGFGGLLDDMFEPRPIRFRLPVKRVERQGKSYWEYAVKLDYTPRQEGEYTFGPATFKGSIITGGYAAGPPVLRDIFTVRVVPPPEEGRPDWFVGAVGSNMQARAALDTAICKVGDPLTLTLEIDGDISLPNLRPPVLSLQPGIPQGLFRIYDENVATETIAKGKRFRYRVRPLRSGTLEFPAIKIAYYDTERRDYATVLTAPLPLQAHATTQIAAATPPEGETDFASRSLTASATRLPDGILLPPAGYRRLPAGPSPKLRSLLCLLPPSLWALAQLLQSIWRRRRQWALRRLRRRALTRALRALRRARAAAAVAGPRAAAGEASQALRLYAEGRLDADGKALTAADFLALLRRRGISEAMAEEMHMAFAALERMAYRPEAARADELGAVIAGLERSLAAADKLLGRHQRHSPVASIMLMLLLLGSVRLHADDAADSFAWERANAAMATARSPDDFLEAARLYNRLAAPGSGPLFFNLGTALLLANDPVNAEAAFIRAERYLGGLPEIRNNWRLAIAARTEQPDAQLPPSRLLFAWHYGLSLHLRIWLACGGWLLLWAGLLLRRFTHPERHRHGAPTATRSFATLLSICGGLLLLFYGASCGATWLQERHERQRWHERRLGPSRPATNTGRAP